MKLKTFAELEVLKSDTKKYYVMSLNKKWHAIALEDFQVTFLQQHIPASKFNLVVDSNKLKEATKAIEILDYTELDDDDLIHKFFDRQKPYEEKHYESEPQHLIQQNSDSRTLNSNKEFSRMNPYHREKTIDNNIYYAMKLANTWYALALEYCQVAFLRKHLKADPFKNPVNAERIAQADIHIVRCDLTNHQNNQLLKMFVK